MPSVSASVGIGGGFIPVGIGVGGQGTSPNTLHASQRNVLDFGAIGDGVHDDTAAFNNALSLAPNIYVPAGKVFFLAGLVTLPVGCNLIGDNAGSTLKFSRNGTNAIQANGSNRIASLTFTGTFAAGVDVSGSDVTVQDVAFRGTNGSLDQCVRVFTADRTRVMDCLFDSCGYGVIQQAGYISNEIIVTRCVCRNAFADFIEFNQAVSGTPGYGFLVAHNVYEGGNGYPAPVTERRFVGVTTCRDVTIIGNIVRNVSGDAPVHLEDTGGNVIVAHNVFENCVGSNSNAGYVYILNSAKSVVIEGNWVVHTDGTLPLAAFVDMSSGAYTCDVTIANNMLVGNATRNLDFAHFGLGQSGRVIIQGNSAKQIGAFLPSGGASNVSVIGNDIDCTSGITPPTNQANSDAGGDWMVANNTIRASGSAILAQPNTNGTQGPRRWVVTGNRFFGNVAFNDPTDLLITSNAYQSGKTFTTSGTVYIGPTRVSAANNVAM